MMRHIALVVAGLMLATVAYAKLYSPPEGVPTATLTVRNKLPVGWIRPATFGEPRNCSRMRTLAKGGLGPPIILAGREIEVPIEAGREFTLYVEVAQGNLSSLGACRVIRAFTPDLGARYLVEASIEGDYCLVSIGREAIGADGKSQYSPVSTRERSVPELHPGYIGSQCVPEQ
jgi:hypothetical protein